MADKVYTGLNDLSSFLLDVIMLPTAPPLPDCFAGMASVEAIYDYLVQLRDILSAASCGDVSGQIPLRGYVGGALKTLQANLKHMTWQTKMIASGDFSQRIEFMGEFSESFNSMVVRLEQTLGELVVKEQALRKANEEFRKEIVVRERVEQALRKSEETLRQQSITDALTGLYNRMHFNAVVVSEVMRSSRYARPVSAIMCDIDHFKRVNDDFGHLVGDKVIKTVAGVLTKQLRAVDTAARYGGEEFVVLLPETAAEDAAVVAERIRVEIEGITIPVNDKTLSVTASFGVSTYRGAEHEALLDAAVSQFIDNADQALYASKNAGRNRVTVFTPT